MKLQKFIKNKKQKQILIGTIIGIVVLIGGITLYHTFAMYKEEKTYNVIKGKVPDFRNCLTLGGATPVIKEGLVPVTISNQGVVTKVNEQSKDWYNYCDKEWANAVILKEGVKTPEDNEEINENDIESYFVWIPKYRYKIFNMEKYTDANGSLNENAAQTIEIEFGITDTQDGKENECTTPNKSGADGNCHKDYWMTHPAFTAFKDSKGMWVGKFETGYKDATSTTEAEQHNEIATNKVIIKPNVYSWRKITVKNMFDTSYNYQRNLDSHMMKNTEWGAVAYLQHSKYGSGESVRINNNSAYVTGYAAKEEPTTGSGSYNNYETPTGGLGTDGTYTINYKNPASQVASTTNNYTGIYDMSGGSWEYVMGVIKGESDSGYTFGSSGFSTSTFPFKTGEEKSQYYDVYDYNTSETTYNRRILGDATGEMGPFGQKQYSSQTRNISSWYDDEAWFAVSTGPWFYRGGPFNRGTGSGIYALTRPTGGVDVYGGFRIVLAPTNENE